MRIKGDTEPGRIEIKIVRNAKLCQFVQVGKTTHIYIYILIYILHHFPLPYGALFICSKMRMLTYGRTVSKRIRKPLFCNAFTPKIWKKSEKVPNLVFAIHGVEPSPLQLDVVTEIISGLIQVGSLSYSGRLKPGYWLIV